MMREELNSYFGDGIRMNGVLKFKGALRFDGDFQGEIQTEGTLIVGNLGKVEAMVNAGNLFNMGRIMGDVKAERKISIFDKSYLNGSIDTPVLVAEEGAILQGSCVMPSGTQKTASNGNDEDLSEILGNNYAETIGKNSFPKKKKGGMGFLSILFTLLFLGALGGGGFFVYKSKNEILEHKISRDIYLYFSKENPDRILKMGDTFYREGNYKKAFEYYKSSGKAESKDLAVIMKLATTLENLGKTEESIPYYETYFDMKPESEEVGAILFEYYSSKGDKEGQIRIQEAIVNRAGSGRLSVERLFRLYKSDKSTDKALALFNERLVSTPPSREDLIVIADLQRSMEMMQKAINTYRQVLELDPENMENRLALAYVLHKSGQEQLAAKEFRVVGRMDSGHVENINNSAFGFLSNGDTKKAIEYFNLALSKSANNIRSYLGLATSYSRMGDNEKTEEYCKKILEIDPTNAPAQNRLAWAYAVGGKNLDEAEQLSLASMKYFKDLPGYMDTLSEVYYNKGDFDGAIEWINKALELSPNDRWFKIQLKKFTGAQKRANR